MIIQHNIPAMNSYRNLNNNQNAIAGNLEKLSSGYQINRAGDNAAGLAISEKMRSQITGLDTAQRNVDDGVSLIKTAEGALQETHDMLNRMTELATQSANGTYDDAVDRDALQKEVDALKSEINRIADSTNFNGINLLDGSMSGAAVSFNTIGSGANTPATTTDIGINGSDEGRYNFSTFAVGDGTCLDNKDFQIGYVDKNGEVQTINVSGTDVTSVDNLAAVVNAAAVDAAGAGSPPAIVASVENGKLVIRGGDADTVVGDIATTGFSTAGSTVYANTSVSSKQVVASTSFDFSKLDDEGVSGLVDKHGTVASGFNIGSGVKIVFTNGEADETVSSSGDTVYVSVYQTDNLALDDSGKSKLLTGDELAEAVANALADARNNSEVGEALHSYNADLTTVGGGVLTLYDVNVQNGGALTLQIGDTSDSYNQLSVAVEDMHTKALGLDDVDISIQANAQDAIDLIKTAINSVSTTRGTLGAMQNRLEHTGNVLSIQEENIQDAESTIRDTDVAAEMMEYTKNNILIQSAQSMLAQANQLPQGVLQLLG